jgi:hypothetical protein
VKERRNKMFVVGQPAPTSSSMLDGVVREERYEYLMLAAAAVSEKEWSKEDVKALSTAFGNFDRVVALGWLIGDLFGMPLLPSPYPLKVGQKAGREAAKAGKAIATAVQTKSRKLSKLKADDPKRQDAIEEADKVEAATKRALVPEPGLGLPSSQECASPDRAVERARKRPLPAPPPPPPECDPQLIKWCANHGWSPGSLVEHMTCRIHERQRRERAWNPTCWREAQAKAKALDATAIDDDLCTCADGTPSWLCRVNRCYATAVGSRCEERHTPRDSCDCMGWKEDEQPCAWNRTSNGRVPTHFDEYLSLPWWFEPHPPTPAAGWPAWDQAARDKAREEGLEADKLLVDGWGPQGNPYLALTAAARGSNMHVLKTAISQAAEMRVFGGKELAVAKTRMVELELQLATMAALG